MAGRCEAVIFDMDGLMIDSEPFWYESQIECFKKVGINLTLKDVKISGGKQSWQCNEAQVSASSVEPSITCN